VRPRARDPEALLQPSCTPDVVTVREITLLRQPGAESSVEAVLTSSDRRYWRSPETHVKITFLSLPKDVVWVTVADSPVELGRHRLAADPATLMSERGVLVPVLEIWLTQASREPSIGMRIAVIQTLGREPAEIERMLARYLSDDTIVGVQVSGNDPSASVRRIALKREAVEVLREHGDVHIRIADPLVTRAQLNGRLARFAILITSLEAWDKQFMRFFAALGQLIRRPIPLITGIIALLAALAALFRLGVL
jgi:hypothetical protein